MDDNNNGNIYSKADNNRRCTTQTIGDILGEILKSQNINKGLFEHRLIGLWGQIMGSSVERVTKQVYVNNGVMYVHLNSSVVRGELVMLKAKIISRLNEAVGQEVLHDIVFR